MGSGNSSDGGPSLVWRVGGRDLVLCGRPLVMGVVNVTPDSFSDGGRYLSPDAAVAHGLELTRQGADLLDVGGESTRPGSSPVPAAEELERVLPVVRALAKEAGVPISVDTSKAMVARACLDAGAAIVNDVTALGGDPDMAEVVRNGKAGAILMHMQGTPATMQQNPRYGDVVSEITDFLRGRMDAAVAAGLSVEQLAVDPGIGFGKTAAHNRAILARLPEFGRLGRPVCLGVSRKGFLGRLLGDRPVDRRLAASLAVVCFAAERRGAHIVRVHDVEATRDVLTVWEALAGEHGNRTGSA